jgi:hypothetical protein
MHDSDSEWNAFDVRTRGLIRAILYPVMFRGDPDESGLARVFKMVIDCQALNASPDEYKAAIQKVLADQVPLQEYSLSASSDRMPSHDNFC